MSPPPLKFIRTDQPDVTASAGASAEESGDKPMVASALAAEVAVAAEATAAGAAREKQRADYQTKIDTIEEMRAKVANNTHPEAGFLEICSLI